MAVSLGRLRPINGSTTRSDAESDVSGTLSGGEQLVDRVSDNNGVRRERSLFLTGDVVTVRVRVDYDLSFERRTLLRGGGERIDHSDRLHQGATGEVYITMFEHEYLAMINRLEQGDPAAIARHVDPPPAFPVAPISGNDSGDDSGNDKRPATDGVRGAGGTTMGGTGMGIGGSP
jgi:hypothetical protein